MAEEDEKPEYGANMGMRSNSFFPTTVHEDGKEYVGDGVNFQRIRRITGYLVGDVNKWNNAKREELKDRVKHIGRALSARNCGCYDREGK